MSEFEFRSQEGTGRSEAAESMEARALDSATFEPASLVEQVGDFKGAEAIQSSLETVMASLTAEQVPVGEVSATPITLPIPKPEEEISATPIPLPHPAEEVSATPITLPIPKPEELPQADLPGKGVVDRGDEVRQDLFEASSGKGDGGDEIIPINLPGIQSTAGGESGKLSQPVDEVGWKMQDKEPGSVETPLPGTGEALYKGEADGIPLPLPGQRPEMAAGEIGGKAAGVSTLPMPIPQPEMAAGEIGGKAAGVSALPTPIPRPEMGPGETAGEAALMEKIIMNTQAAMDEMAESFNLQYLQLQEKMQQENRRYSTQSNILKDKNDTAKNSINNIR